MLEVRGQEELIADTFCERPFTRMKITPEGDVSVCCFQKRNTIGNLFQHSFEKIWLGPRAEAIRTTTKEGRLHSTCVTDTCPFVPVEKLHMFETTFGRFPTMIELDLPTQHCNIGGEYPSPDNPACLMCERSTHFERQEDRLDEVCEIISPYVKYLNHVHIQGVAEPFWKNKIFDLLDKLKLAEHKDHLSLSSTTNATILNEERRAKYLEYPNSYLTFSLDAATPGTYRVIRVWDAYDKVIKNMMDYSKERTSVNQKIIIHNNINLININDVVGMVEVAAKAEVFALEFNPTYAVETICVNKDNAKLFKRAEDEIRKTAEKLGVKVVFIRPLDLNLTRKKTHQITL